MVTSAANVSYNSSVLIFRCFDTKDIYDLAQLPAVRR